VLPRFLYPDDPILLISALALGLVLDIAYPYHSGILLRIHPVHTSYFMAKKLGRPYGSRALGVATWLVVVGTHMLLYSALLYIAWSIHPILWILAAGWILKVSASLRLLIDTVRRVGEALNKGDIDGARYWAQQIVRRNVYKLEPEHVASAAIESLAESLVDGFTSPLLYYAVLGPLGALLQRLANTLDGALGFLTPEYRDVGWFSAKVDTVLNYVPARLTAVLILLMSPLVKGEFLTWAVRTWRVFSRATPSVNAGHPMSAMAGALGVWLEKPGAYRLGDRHARSPSPRDIEKGIRASMGVAVTTIALVIAIILMIGHVA